MKNSTKVPFRFRRRIRAVDPVNGYTLSEFPSIYAAEKFGFSRKGIHQAIDQPACVYKNFLWRDVL